MRRRSLLLLSSSLFAAGTFAIAACEDSESGPGANLPPTAGFDSGSPTPINNLADGGLPDVVAPAVTGVTITVIRSARPLADVRVLSHDATGAVIADQRTGADGKVTMATPPNMVTVVARAISATPSSDEALYLVTYLGVADGDQLVVDDSPGRFDNAQNYAIANVTMMDPGLPTAINYRVAVTKDCYSFTESAAQPLEVPLRPRCVRAKTAVLASVAGNDAPLYSWLKGQTPPPKGGTLNATLGAWSMGTTVNVKATNVPDGTNNTQALFSVIADDLPFSNFNSGIGDLLTTGLDFPVPPNGFTDAIQGAVYAETQAVTAEEYSFRALVQRQAPGATMTFDLATALPKITNFVTTMPTPKRPEATWSSTSPLDISDGGYVRFQWGAMLGPDAFGSVVWTFVVPPNTTSVKSPVLPDDIAKYGATQLDDIDLTIAFAESSLLPGYRELKALPVMAGELGRIGDLYEPLPVNGSVRITSTRPLQPGD